MTNDNTAIKVPMTVKIFAGDVLVAETKSRELFNFALDYILKHPSDEEYVGEHHD